LRSREKQNWRNEKTNRIEGVKRKKKKIGERENKKD
jgi:hypothetical protein